MSRFVEFRARGYNNGCYTTTHILVALDEISRVIECEDDYDFTNLITKDGKIRNLTERYSEVVKKIRNAEIESKR